MVILQKPDGSYYIAPSPPSFYKSPTPSTPSPSTGGGGSSAITPPTKTEDQLVEEMRQEGRAYLEKHPEAFGGGISPTTGQRTPTGLTTEQQVLGQTITPGQVKDQPFYFDKEPAKQSYGVLTVTPEEAKYFKKEGVSYWKQEAKTPSEGIAEGSFAGRIPQKYRTVKTKGIYEYNIRNLIAGKQIYKQTQADITAFKQDPKSFEGLPGVITTPTKEGTQYELTSEYFDKRIDRRLIYSDALVQAKTRYSELPKKTRHKLSWKGYEMGRVSAMLGVAEFSGGMVLNLGQQTIKPGEKIGFSGKSFKFGGTLGKWRDYPSTTPTVTFLEDPLSYAKQKATSPGTVGQASVYIPLAYLGIKGLASNIKSYGWKTGIAETVSGFSPLKIKSGIYAQGITSKTTFKDIKSLKYTDTKGITTRIYRGSSGDIKLFGVEKSAVIKGKTIGGGYSVTRTPTIEIRGGGSYVKPGIRQTFTPYKFTPGGTGTAYKGTGTPFFTQVKSPLVKGGTSNILSSKGVTIYATDQGATVYSHLAKGFKYTGGSAYRDIKPGLRQFTSGQAKAVYKTTFGDKTFNLDTGTATRDFIHAPTSRYKLDPKLSGVEVDLNRIIGGIGDKGFTSFQGGRTGLGTRLDTTGLNINLPTTQPVIFKSPTITPIPKITTQQKGIPRQMFEPISQFVKTETPKIETKIDTKVISTVIPETIQKSRSRGRTKQIAVTIPKIETIPKVKQKPETIQGAKVIQVRKIKVPQVQQFATLTPFGYGSTQLTTPYTPTSYIPTIPITPPFIAGTGGFMGLGKVGAKVSPARYTPSFKALFFKIKGKAPTGIATGLRFRPITKAFSFQRKRKIIKLRKIKL